jgi:hypothetical protein
MRALIALLGAVFLLAGLAGLIHPRVMMPAKRSDVWVGKQELKMETRQVVIIPTSMGVLAILAGAGLLYMGIRRPG